MHKLGLVVFLIINFFVGPIFVLAMEVADKRRIRFLWRVYRRIVRRGLSEEERDKWQPYSF